MGIFLSEYVDALLDPDNYLLYQQSSNLIPWSLIFSQIAQKNPIAKFFARFMLA